MIKPCPTCKLPGVARIYHVARPRKHYCKSCYPRDIDVDVRYARDCPNCGSPIRGIRDIRVDSMNRRACQKCYKHQGLDVKRRDQAFLRACGIAVDWDGLDILEAISGGGKLSSVSEPALKQRD